MSRYLYLFHLLLLVMTASAQTPGHEFTFSNLNTSDGLSHNCVTSICQDSCGYLWLGTYDGLNLYDGYHFKIYRHIKDDPATISGNQIRQVVTGKNYNQWILTDKGLDRLDQYTEKITHYSFKEKIIHIWYSSKNDLLALTQHQLYRYLPAEDSLLPVISSPGNFITLTENQQGHLYLGTSHNSIQVYSSDFQSVKELPPFLNTISRGNISHLHTDSENRLWVAFTNQIFGKFDSLQQNFTPIPVSDYTLIDRDIRSIRDFDSHHLLIGAFNGLFLLDKNTGKVTPTSPAIGQEGELSHFSIYSLYKDCQGILWVGTNKGGVNFNFPCNSRFSFINPTRYSGLIGMGQEDQQGHIWFATEGGGLLCYDPVSRQQHNYLLNTVTRQEFNNNIIKAIHISGDSIFCTTHQGEVYLFSIRTRQYKLLYDFRYNNIPCVYKDSHHNLWIATNTQQGLVKLKDGHLSGKFRTNAPMKSLNQVTAITEVSSGKLLFGTEKGIYSYDSATDSLSQIPIRTPDLSSDILPEVTALLTDSGGHIWISTVRHGLLILNQNLNLIQTLSHPTIPAERILSLTESPDGQFWFTTNRKLFCYSPTQHTCKTFDVFNGMLAQEFSPNSAFISSNGHLYLPGNKGITTVNTRRFPVNTQIPPVWLTTLHINNQQVTVQSHPSLLPHSLCFTTDITLRHNETNLTIGYTALNFIYPLSNHYAYYLEGIDPDWLEVGGQREAIYNNLPPGNYTFYVKASNNDGIWNTNGPVLRIRVLAPLWQRWWAWLTYGLIFFALLRQYFIYRQRKLTLEHELHFSKLQQEQSEKIHQERLHFFTQIAHEFRTPLTLIINPLDELSSKTIHISGAKETISLIRKNTQRLLVLTNNLLNIQQQETGKAKLHPTTFDFHGFMQELYYTFQSTAQNRNIHFSLDMPDDVLPVNYDRDELEKAIFNLLSNAFKFTPAGGTVTLSAHLYYSEPVTDCITTPANRLQIEVKDNGIGIAPEDRHKLFEPFAVSHKDLHGEIPGSGIGLSIVRTIVSQHQGTIDVQDVIPQGTCISIHLPYTPATLPTEHLPGIIPEIEATDTRQAIVSERTYCLLIVDDNPEIRSYLAGQLEKEYKVRTAEDGKIAFGMASNETIDLIISDIMMPVLDGKELCRLIKSSAALCHIPVILLTAKAMTMHIEEGFNAGADDYLIKPFKISALKARIRNILQERERLKEIYSQKLSLKNAGIELEPIDKKFTEQYIAIIRQNISNPDFSIENLCNQLGMSRAAFYRKIKAITTLSPAEMIRNIRLECASELLKTTSLSAAEIAFQVGFGSYAHFSTYFKATYGVSPKVYKEKAGIPTSTDCP